MPKESKTKTKSKSKSPKPAKAEETKLEVVTETKPEVSPVESAKPSTTTVSKPQKTKSKAKSKAKSKDKTKSVEEPKNVPKTKPEPLSEAQPEPLIEPLSEPPIEPQPEPQPEPQSEPVKTETTDQKAGKKDEQSAVEHLTQMYNDLLAEVANLQKQVKEAKKETLAVLSTVEKQLTKSNKKRKTPKPSTVHYSISPNLAKFFGEDENVTLTRQDAEAKIRAYIKESGLENPENRREIFPDEKLSTICASGKEPFLYIGGFKKNIKHNFLNKIDDKTASSSE